MKDINTMKEVAINGSCVKRDLFTDCLKAILIVLVVLGHACHTLYDSHPDSYWDNPLVAFIYSFHMPLFIAISGYYLGVSKSTNLTSFIKKKSLRLLLPIITIATISYVIDLSFHNITSPNTSLFKRLYQYLTMYWYLDCLFVLTIIVKIFEKWGKKSFLLLILLEFLSILGYDYLPGIFFKNLQLIRLMPIFLSSYFVAKNRNKIFNKFQCWYKYILLFSLLICCIIVSIYGINLMKYPCIMRIAIGLVGSLTVCCVIWKTYSFIPYYYYTHIARNSLGIYIIHVPFYKYCPSLSNPLEVMVLTIFLILTSSLLTDVIRNTQLKKYILGESN